MAELIGGSGYDDVQNTAPTSPSIGDTWLDTSTDPPTGKIYVDLGGGGQWTTGLLDTQISSRSSHSDPDPNGYIDAPISSAGASRDDIIGSTAHRETGSGLGSNLSTGNSRVVYSVTGSGVVFYVNANGAFRDTGNYDQDGEVRLFLDGSMIWSQSDRSGFSASPNNPFYPFSSSLELHIYNSGSDTMAADHSEINWTVSHTL